MQIGERWSISMDRHRAWSLTWPTLQAALPLLAVAFVVLYVRRSVEDDDTAARATLSWGVTGGLALLLWLAGRLLRRTDPGLRMLLALAAGLSISGGVVLWRATGETFPGNGGNPDTELGLLGVQSMVVALGALLAAFGIDYRRSDPWYVLAFGGGLLPMLITAVLWFAGLRDAAWL